MEGINAIMSHRYACSGFTLMPSVHVRGHECESRRKGTMERIKLDLVRLKEERDTQIVPF